MSTTNPTGEARRKRVEKGIYERRAADGRRVLEIGWRDARGKQRWRVVAGGIKVARAELAGEHAKRARGEKVAADPRITFESAAEAWRTARVIHHRPATQARYGADLKHLREAFGRHRLTDIGASEVAVYIARKKVDGLKGWTIKGHVNVLSAVFTYAARHLGFVGTNPTTLLDRVERPNTSDARDHRVLTTDELGAVLASTTSSYLLLFEAIAETGLRHSEALGLVWSDVDMQEATLTLTHQLGRDRKRHPLKTKRSRRSLEMTDVLAAKLRRAKLAAVRSGPYDPVFTNLLGEWHDQRSVARGFDRAAINAGLEAVKRDGVLVQRKPTIHDLRHTHASRLIAAGWDVAEVSARLGHANVATTLSLYVHEFEKAQRSDDRRSRLTAIYAPGVEANVEAAARSTVPQTAAEVVELPRAREGSQ